MLGRWSVSLLVVVAVSGVAASRVTAPPTVKIAASKLGPIVVDARGRTLYLFTADVPGSISCTSDNYSCTTLWPPLLTHGAPHAGKGIAAGLLRTVHRTSPAGVQVTYNGHPLYRYSDDKKAGDLAGQGFAGYWYVVSAKGKAIKKLP